MTAPIIRNALACMNDAASCLTAALHEIHRREYDKATANIARALEYLDGTQTPKEG